MKKKLAVILAFILSFIAIPIQSFADSGELPKLGLPKLNPLQTPTLSKSYQDMQKKLEEQGLGQYKYNSGSLPLPDVKSPDNAGKTAYEKFLQEYGDMWNSSSNQLDKTSIIPDDQFFKDYINAFENANERLFNNIKEIDRKNMNELLNKKLDMSGLWDFESLKKQIQFKDTSSLLANVQKPDGWDAVKSKSFEVPNMSNWLNGPKAKGYGKQLNLIPFLLDKLKLNRNNNPTPPAPQAQVSPSYAVETSPSFVPKVGVVPGYSPSPSSSKDKEKSPAPSPAPVPAFSERLQNFGRTVLEVGKKAAPYLAVGALAAIAWSVAGPAGLAVAAGI